MIYFELDAHRFGHTEGQHVGRFVLILTDHGQPPQLWQATRMLHAVLALTGEGEAGFY